MAVLLSVNLAVPQPNRGGKKSGPTGIDKRPAAGPVEVRAPGEHGSGLVGDGVFDKVNHGGDGQAVYAYAREDLDRWQAELGRELTGGTFGENLTTRGLDVTGARIGERWRIGADVVLEVTVPRIPCTTFAAWMDEPQWIKRFTAGRAPGSYLRVVEPGTIRAGDEVSVITRPEHGVTIAITFRALTTEPELLPRLLDIEELPDWVRKKAARRSHPSPAS
jgi:MOSC domain-containing protein YiiM